MRNFVKGFISGFCIIVTMVSIAVIICVKCGLITKTVHTDKYVTTCNDVVIDEKYVDVTDSIDFDLDIHTNLFTRQ